MNVANVRSLKAVEAPGMCFVMISSFRCGDAPGFWCAGRQDSKAGWQDLQSPAKLCLPAAQSSRPKQIGSRAARRSQQLQLAKTRDKPGRELAQELWVCLSTRLGQQLF